MARQPSGGAPDSYVIFGTVPWDAPWLTEHNLAHALAERHRVLFVEPPVTVLSPFRYGLRPERLREARFLLGRRLRRYGRVHVYRPVALPPREQPLAKTLSRPLLRRQLRSAAERAGVRKPAVVAARTTLGLEGAVAERVRVYLVKDLVESGGELVGASASALAAETAAMCERADLVCAVTPALRDRVAASGHRAALLQHGFHADLAPAYDAAAEPAAYAGLPRPLLGYTGRIDGRLDFGLLGALADAQPEASLVLVGPTSPRLDQETLAELSRRPNVHLVGSQPREALPAFVRHLDCALMPYGDREWLRYASPLKLWDYLYAGPPVVGAGCTVLRDYPPPLVRYSETREEFLDAVRAALSEPAEAAEERRRFALANSWDVRAAQLVQLVQELDQRPDARATAPR
jgi:teichuronic acid biosynthesis glycosyltransferase TuaH